VGLNVVLLVPRDEAGTALVSGVYLQSWTLLYVLALFVFLSLRTAAPKALGIALALSAYTFLTTIWSVSPDSTVRGAISLATTILVAYAMAVDLTSAELLQLVARVITTLTIAGIVAYFLGMHLVYYIDAHARPNYLGLTPLRGFYTHKIAGSMFAVLGMIASVVTFKGWKRAVAVASALLFVLLAGSATGLVLAIVACLMFVVAFWARSRKVSLASIVLLSLPGIGAVALFGASNYSELLELMGRDETLTGRTQLWEAGLHVWSQSPIIGWGYEAYLDSPVSNWIQMTYGRFQNYDVPHFHSSYIQTAVDLGGIGLAALAVMLIRVTWVSGRRAIVDANIAAAGILVMVVVWLTAAPFMILFLKGNFPVTLLLFAFLFQTLRTDEPAFGGASSVKRLPRARNALHRRFS
jgi:O-antigen ligase